MHTLQQRMLASIDNQLREPDSENFILRKLNDRQLERVAQFIKSFVAEDDSPAAGDPVFDFMCWLTTRPQTLTVGGTVEVYDAFEAYQEFRFKDRPEGFRSDKDDLRAYCGANAMRWAEVFVETAADVYGLSLDREWVIGWFANAIGANHTHHLSTQNRSIVEAVRKRAPSAATSIVDVDTLLDAWGRQFDMLSGRSAPEQDEDFERHVDLRAIVAAHEDFLKQLGYPDRANHVSLSRVEALEQRLAPTAPRPFKDGDRVLIRAGASSLYGTTFPNETVAYVRAMDLTPLEGHTRVTLSRSGGLNGAGFFVADADLTHAPDANQALVREPNPIDAWGDDNQLLVREPNPIDAWGNEGGREDMRSEPAMSEPSDWQPGRYVKLKVGALSVYGHAMDTTEVYKIIASGRRPSTYIVATAKATGGASWVVRAEDVVAPFSAAADAAGTEGGPTTDPSHHAHQ
jgi:hypothetical protein